MLEMQNNSMKEPINNSDDSSSSNLNSPSVPGKKRSRRASKSNPNISRDNQVISNRGLPEINERGSLKTEEPFHNTRSKSPTNFQALRNESEVYDSQQQVITVAGGKTYAGTSELPLNVADFANE